MNPTKKQKIMLDFIDGFVKGRGYSPTLREIMQALGYKSVSTVAKHVDNLIARGLLVKRDGEARSLELANEQLDEPWWVELKKEIARREGQNDEKSQSERGILSQALKIVQK